MIIHRNELGQLHRVDGPALTIPDGTQLWYLNDQLHRDDGPAIEWEDGTRLWYLNNQQHRTDGPAVMRANGTQEWWLNGVQVDELTVWLLAGAKEHA